MKNPISKTQFNDLPEINMTNTTDGIPVRQLDLVRDQINLYKKLFIVTILANTILATMGFIYL